jgi:flagellar hook protein FlgE
MSFLGTIFSGTTGLLTFSRGLDVISNNVANLNTPGFKRSDLLFRELFYQFQLTGDSDQEAATYKNGNGVTAGGTTTIFEQGDIQQTGNTLDAAVNGNGFFILRNESGTTYSRVGQFAIDDEGFLVVAGDESTRVAGIGENGELVDINITALRSNPARATTEITFRDNLSSGSTEHVIDDVEVFDSLGERHLLTITLTNNSSETPRSWLIEVENEDGDVLATDLEIRFQGNGSPEEEFNSVSFLFEPEDADAGDISLFFGEPGEFTGATSFSAGANSDLAVDSQDGFTFGSLTQLGFSRDGTLEIEYSNGETAEAGQLMLAWLSDIQSMRQVGNGRFVIDDPERLEVGAAAATVMGDIVSGSIEISNIELSQEFTDLVIVQRGFQVSSQVVSIANEMMQQLLDTVSPRQ